MSAFENRKKEQNFLHKMLDKSGSRWYYIKAVREGGIKNAKAKEIWKKLEKIVDKWKKLRYNIKVA